jgi:hypothetical protein
MTVHSSEVDNSKVDSTIEAQSTHPARTLLIRLALHRQEKPITPYNHLILAMLFDLIKDFGSTKSHNPNYLLLPLHCRQNMGNITDSI